MHKALLVVEVFICILECLARDTIRAPDEDVTGTGWGALAALAQTCRTLSDPALDLLWRRLHGLEPIVRCLRGMDGGLYRRAMHVFSDEEWGVLQRYVPRVQELTVDKWSEEWSLKILRSLMFCTTPLLPNLRQLRWVCGQEADVVYIRPLLSPTITYLDVTFGYYDTGTALPFLQSCHRLCPNLNSIRFRYEHQHMATEVSRAICRAQNLESIDCGLIDVAAFTHIAQSLTLKSLSAWLPNDRSDRLENLRAMRDLAWHSSHDLVPFRNVKVINLHIEDLSFMIPLLQPHNQLFNNISLTFHVVPTTVILHAFFSALGSTPRQGSVRRVELRQLTTLDANIDRHYEPLIYDSLCPLLSFPHLRELVLELDNPVSLNDEELMMLARAWPRLEVFKINCRSGWRVHSSANPLTLKGLVSLLRLCPMLCELGLSLDVRDVPLPSIDPRALQVLDSPSSEAQQGPWGVRNTSVTLLQLSDSPIKDPALVATFLAEILPSLEAVVTPRTIMPMIVPPVHPAQPNLPIPFQNPLIPFQNPLIPFPNPLPPGFFGGAVSILRAPAGFKYWNLWSQVNEHLRKRAGHRCRRMTAMTGS
ncbi:hypothetical protein HYDPIDRAFT_30819 [Hydnomerulius pinastri MD-312]|uniref:Unplaced genomic scaffold scaffold_24, whole genome shotgun sequence n=1 Tax=Hydnomerulius pinastri MD-312 TaxID=994086 RepID=A0A0C9W5K3_9AGAM|nr:hypothetical protein HYDPIDRAFT_30819 [Hydnomerulius pinastri MD-312]